MEIGTEAVQLPEKEYVNGIFSAINRWCIKFNDTSRLIFTRSTLIPVITAKFDIGVNDVGGKCAAGVYDAGGKFATGVNDASGKFAAGVNDASGKFAAGVNDAGGKFAAGVNDAYCGKLLPASPTPTVITNQ